MNIFDKQTKATKIKMENTRKYFFKGKQINTKIQITLTTTIKKYNNDAKGEG